ncbi:PREDICTED: uncharacterized protein LOC109465292 [Branchiostoma belcheri]|uniref:Uncharacterized protein LOC109465292 n=1 Tax=Branchiostoma belcheri TaxID=7741 RepID=A0A6P4YGZ2_BRABE|nr:PREDICTED: uncharacterized protein LOC109465292 [Branchiostoma belcheri]XP_019618045.1 PREDICTED: uncharacterized protein LOC109465292 [Branchiostoma belcheri]XP_019618046.1 PREDICTED: uncharacterized protein LOC109465292 [Branchiostoma belcheri]XP_019618047.1 PREDICTED: uncharacterized protein LOC109465292 [Branchiostoma belcheri]XP_019618048.1 PREDICTED: uncharacterized protein LOC109465292 [Branchiostoma belcheri]
MNAQKKMMEAAFAAGTSAGGATDTDGLAKVILKVENAVDPDWPATVNTVVLVPPGSSVYHMLLQAFKDGKIAFNASWYGQYWSHFIDSLNGLKNQGFNYWNFQDGEGNEFDRGVDLISVYDGDVIKFRYVEYSLSFE